MRTKTLGGFLALLSLLGVVTQAAPLGTAFTYQGQLSDGGLPANGNYDFTFTLFDQGSSGSPIAGPLTNAMVDVNHGLFATTLDFGHGVLTGNDRWLEIAVRGNGVPTSFTTLTPRQLLTASPYALFAPNAGAAASAVTASTVAAGGVAGASLQANAVTTDKIADDTVAAADVNAATFNSTFWRASGNIGTTPGTHFIGTTDHQPMEIKVNSRRAFRLEPDATQDAPNLIAGSSANAVSPGVVGAVIGGGGRDVDPNRVLGAWGTIGGGQGNVVSNHYDVISGGLGNRAGGGWSTVGGGSGNAADNVVLGRATVAGGMDNHASGQVATVGGGRDNAATNSYATVPGGRNNLAGGEDSLAAGRRALALHDGAFVWADVTDADFASTKANQFLVRAGGGVGIGTNHPQSALHVAGTVTANSFSGSGAGLTGLSGAALDAGSVIEAALGPNAVTSSKIADFTITANDVQANAFWKSTGNSGTTPATQFLGTTDNQPLELRVNNLRGLWLEPKLDDANRSNIVNVVGGSSANTVGGGVYGATISGGGAANWFGSGAPNRVFATFGTIGGGRWNTIGANGDSATIGGGFRNTIQSEAWYATIPGGYDNAASGWAAAVGGGWTNTASGGKSTVGGGERNAASGEYATVGGGHNNTASGFWAVVGGGDFNEATNARSTVAGGERNTASGAVAAIAGGCENVANGNFAAVPGGTANSAGGAFSFAAGRRAKANHIGAFVWADSTDADFASTAPNQFSLRATGGVRIDTGSAPGVSLNAADRALLTCGWDPFTSGAHSGVGRWGLFMEPHTLVVGMPALGGKTVRIVRYNENSTYSPLATFDQSGNLTIGGTLVELSDRDAKENFTPVDSREILEKVAALPLSRWNFKTDAQAPHLGPMAQDFHAAFRLGTDDKHIATVDADGVALAAIQGLNQRLNEQASEIQELKRVIAELKATGAKPPSVR